MATSELSIYNRIWVYSQTEDNLLLGTSKKMSATTTKLGRVVVNGVSKPYTSIVKSMEDIKYPDSVVVTQGDIRQVKYTEHKLY